MQQFTRWLMVSALLFAGGQGLLCQTVKLLADVDVSTPFVLRYTRVSVDGQYVACAYKDSVGVLRLRTYPTERRDTIAIPDSVTSVRCVGFMKDRLLLAFQLRTTGRTHFATIDNDGKEWRSVPDVLSSLHPSFGVLETEMSCIIAPGQSTAVLGSYYRSTTTPTRSTYITTIINTQTLTTLQSYDSVGTLRVSPGGREYYYTKMAPDSSSWLCVYFDATTGKWSRTVRCFVPYYYATGIDHVMYTTKSIGTTDAESVTVLPGGRSYNGCLASPNILSVITSSDTVQRIEAYDVLKSTSMLIDTIRALGVYTVVNDVDRLLLVHVVGPFRFRVYKYEGLEGSEGLACIRNVDTTLVFSVVDYSTVHLSRTRDASITAKIDGKEYAMNGRTAPLRLRYDRIGQVPFSATARNAQGVVIDSMVRTPLVVRRPSAYTDAVKVPQAAMELALSENEESLSVFSDSMMTMIPIISGATPMLDTTHARIIRDGSLHTTQTHLLPSNTYVKIVLRDDDPNRPEYRRSLDQLVVGLNGDTSLIRSVLLSPEVIVRKVRTVWNAADSLLGLALFTSNPGPGRLYLSKRTSGTWMPVGDSSGIAILNGDRVDISVPGLIMTTGTSGALSVTNILDGTVILDTNDGRAHALLVDDSTFITTERVWKFREGTWQAQPTLSRNTYINADAVRMSASTSLLFRQDRNMIGYLVDHSSAAVVDSIIQGFPYPGSAVYSKRYRGLFIGNYGGVVGFVPIDPKFLDPTSAAFEYSPKAPLGITSCILYTVHGSRVASVACTAPLSAADVTSLAIFNGLYIAVYTQEHGEPITQLIIVGR